MTHSRARSEFEAMLQRKRLVDDFWLLAMFAVMAAIAVPWFLGFLDLPLTWAAWACVAFAGVYFMISAAVERYRSVAILISVATGLHVIGIVALALIWHFSGGWRHPVVLTVFVLPVVAGSLVFTRWQSLCFALVGTASVTFLALLNSESLQWYLAQRGLNTAPLLSLFADLPDEIRNPFPASGEAPAQVAGLLVGFLLLMLAAAAGAESIGGFLRRVERRSQVAMEDLGKAQSLSDQMLMQSAIPSLIVARKSLQILSASELLCQQFFLDPKRLPGQTIVQALNFLYPEVMEGLLAGEMGSTATVVCQVGEEKRVLQADAKAIGGGDFVHVSFTDMTECHALRAALDAAEDAMVLVDSSSRVLLFNSAAKRWIETLEAGVKADAVLSSENLPFGWWELGMRSRQERTVRLAGRTFKSRSIAARLPGDREPVTIISLLPKEEAP